MIDLEHSKPELFQIAVPPGKYAFPDECLLCGERDQTPVKVAFTKVLILGFLGGIESVVVDIPLCSRCACEYRERESKRVLKMILSFVLGVAALILSFILCPTLLNEKM